MSFGALDGPAYYHTAYDSLASFRRGQPAARGRHGPRPRAALRRSRPLGPAPRGRRLLRRRGRLRRRLRQRPGAAVRRRSPRRCSRRPSPPPPAAGCSACAASASPCRPPPRCWGSRLLVMAVAWGMYRTAYEERTWSETGVVISDFYRHRPRAAGRRRDRRRLRAAAAAPAALGPGRGGPASGGWPAPWRSPSLVPGRELPAHVAAGRRQSGPAGRRAARRARPAQRGGRGGDPGRRRPRRRPHELGHLPPAHVGGPQAGGHRRSPCGWSPVCSCSRSRWCAAGSACGCRSALAGAGVVVLMAVGSTVAFDTEHPRFTSIYYRVDESGAARWQTVDRVDDWTRQFLRQELAPHASRTRTSRRWECARRSSAPPRRSASRRRVIEVLSDATTGDRRTVRLRLRSPRGAQVVSLLVHSVVGGLTASVDGPAAAGLGHDDPRRLRRCAGGSTTTRRRPAASSSPCASPPGRPCCCAPWTSATGSRPQLAGQYDAASARDAARPHRRRHARREHRCGCRPSPARSRRRPPP